MIICPTCYNQLNYCDCFFQEDEYDLFKKLLLVDIIPDDVVIPECDKIWHPTVDSPFFELFPKVKPDSQYTLVNDFKKSIRYSFHNGNEFMTGDVSYIPEDVYWPHVQYTNIWGTTYYSYEVAMGYPDGSVRFTVLYSNFLLTPLDVGDAIKKASHKFEWFTWEERNEADLSGEMNQGLRGNTLIQGDKTQVLRQPPPGYIIDYGGYEEEEFDGESDDDLLPDRAIIPIPPQLTVGEYVIEPNVTRSHSIFSVNYKTEDNLFNLQRDPYVLCNLSTNDAPVHDTILSQNTYIVFRAGGTTREFYFAVNSCNPFIDYENYAWCTIKFTPFNLTSPDQLVEIDGIQYPYNEAFEIQITHNDYGFETLTCAIKAVNSTSVSFSYLVEVTGYWPPMVIPKQKLPQWEIYLYESEPPNWNPDYTYSPSKFENRDVVIHYLTTKSNLKPNNGFLLRGECTYLSDYGEYSIAGVPLGGAGASPIIFDSQGPDGEGRINSWTRLPGAQSNLYGIIKY